MTNYLWQTTQWQKHLKESNQVQKTIVLDWIFFEKRSIWLGKTGFFAIGLNSEQVNNIDESFIIKVNSKLIKKYFKKFITPYTAIIDLEKTTDEILSEMKPKWRYNIKLAQKKWVEVKKIEKTKESIKMYYDLMLETTSRDWFSGHSIEYYESFLNNIAWSELYLAFIEEKAISWGIFVFDKNVSIYYYWASTSDSKFRNLMAPYQVQWSAIEYAKSIWSKYYDFLWVATPWEENSSLAWVTDFKWKFTSDFREVSKSYIMITDSKMFFILNLVKWLKKIIKK